MLAFFQYNTMAWNVDDLYKFMKFLINKNQAGGINSQQFFYAWNSEQRSYMEDLLGRFQNRGNQKTGSNTGLIDTQTILQKLSPFTQNFPLVISGGDAVKPYDFIYTLAIRAYGTKYAKSFPITKDQIWAVEDDVIDPPSVSGDSFFHTEYQDFFRFLPSSTSIAVLDYVGYPQDVVWAYTVNVYAYGRYQYNAAASVQPQWDDNTIIEITKRTLRTLGVHFKDNEFEQFGTSVIATGD